MVVVVVLPVGPIVVVVVVTGDAVLVVVEPGPFVVVVVDVVTLPGPVVLDEVLPPGVEAVVTLPVTVPLVPDEGPAVVLVFTALLATYAPFEPKVYETLFIVRVVLAAMRPSDCR